MSRVRRSEKVLVPWVVLLHHVWARTTRTVLWRSRLKWRVSRERVQRAAIDVYYIALACTSSMVLVCILEISVRGNLLGR